jgi:tyrocidine synthetase-3
MHKLDKKNIEDIFALTPMQEGMLLHYLKNPESNHYFEQLFLKISGEINLQLFKKAWDYVVLGNQMLRTFFRWKKLEKSAQVVLKQHHPTLGFFDLSTLKDDNEKQSRLETIKIEDRQKKFDLGEVPFRVLLCKVANKDYRMVISNHHILYDGWSTGIILKEFLRAYAVLEKGEANLEIKVKPPFREFIRWYQNRDRDKQKRFWAAYLKGFTVQTPLPIKRKGIKPDSEKAAIKAFSFALEKRIKESLDGFLKERRVTSAAVFYCAWGLLLQKYCGSDDVVFGTTVSGRSAPINGIEHMTGLFINTLPLRVTSKTDEPLSDLLLRVNEDLPDREKYENTPLVDIYRYSYQEAGQELFDSLLVIENYPLDYFLKGENRTLPLTVHSYSAIESTPYDLNIAITLHDRIEIRLIYSGEIFAEDVIVRLSHHFIRILNEIIFHPCIPFHAIDILSLEERKQLLLDFNDIGTGFPNEKTIHGLFAEQARRTPDRVALVGTKLQIERLQVQVAGAGGTGGSRARKENGLDVLAEIQLSYHQLDEKSQRLAWYLLETGVKPGEPVGIMVQRSLEMILGILGILKAGCGYLSLNPQAPSERIHYLLTDSNAKILITNEENSKPFDFPCSILQPFNPSGLPSSHPHLPPTPATSLAYIIYTSGSTGNPRGVPITHANFSALVHWGYRHLGIGPSDRSVQNLSYYFDWSVWEIFIALTSGASLYMVPGEVVPDAERYLDFIHRFAITVLHITPTHFQSMLHVSPGQRLNTLRYLCIGAEKLNCDLVERTYTWVHQDCRVFNMYGPTEATIMAAVLEIDKAKLPEYNELSSVPIGKNLGNNVLLVLDQHLHPTPLFVPGELYIGGDGIALGYLNNPELTFEKFCLRRPGTFLKKGSWTSKNFLLDHSPLYRTGDLARWLPDGTVEFLGRMDQQVKIRGFRIEPGEIEKYLLEHREVKDALVTAEEYENGDKYLCAYIVPQPGCSSLLSKTLKEYLSGRLPDYMVPAYFVTLDKIPLNPNGKVDLKALPGPVVTGAKGYMAPRNDRERVLVDIWARVLGIDAAAIGIEDDFFQLGGHSLNVTTLIGRIHKELNIEVPFIEVFVNPTVRELAAYIGQKKESRYGEILPIEEKEYYPLSPGQRRLFVLQQMEGGCTAYNIHGLLKLEGAVNKKKLGDIFVRLIGRHESLRTSFEMIEGEPVQRIHKELEIQSKVFGSPEPFFQKGFWPPEAIIKNFIRPFDLSRAPLLRVGLIELAVGPGTENENRHGHALLMVDLHHIIADGASLEVFIKEFTTLYRGEELPALHLRYKDFSLWYSERNKIKALKSQKSYWLKQFEGEIPLLDLPTDFARPVVQSFAGAHYNFIIDSEETRALKTTALAENTTLYGILTTAFTIFLSKLSGQEDIIIGTPVIGRKSLYVDLAHIIGMFVNTMVLRQFPCREKCLSNYIKEVAERTAEAYENQEYPFENLVENIAVTRDPGRNPLFDVMFAMQNLDREDIQIPGLVVKPYPFDDQIAKFDLMFICEPTQDQLLFTVEYSSKIFTKETIKRFVNYFRKIMAEVWADREKRIGDIEIITAEENQEILYRFNHFEPGYAKDKTILQLFKEQAAKTPDYIALVGTARCGSPAPGDSAVLPVQPVQHVQPVSLTYHELNEQSNRLAGLLIEKGVQPDTVVGIMMERSIEMIVGIFGILAAGGAYMPIDLSYPEERINYMLKDSTVRVLVTTPKLQVKVKAEAAENVGLPSGLLPVSINIETDFESAFKPSLSTLTSTSTCQVSPANLAYIIYTSGSTGRPKGVMIEHHSVINRLNWMQEAYPIGPGDVILQKTPVVFDVSVWELFWWSFQGASLCLLGPGEEKDPGIIAGALPRFRITTMHFVPSMLNAFLVYFESLSDIAKEIKKLSSLKQVFSSGEALAVSQVERFYQLFAAGEPPKLINLYGPTEATVDVSFFECPYGVKLEKVPIGKPIDNIRLYVLDRELHLQPVGISGELYIAGAGLARGYINSPALTFEKFCLRRPGALFEKTAPGPHKNFLLYQSPITNHHSPIYRTGDLGRWRLDGNIEFLGRIDYQVKIRGYRIELGEIENRLLRHGRIREAVVHAKEDISKDKYLAAYFVSDLDISKHELKEYLLMNLPDYMIPSFFIRLEALPLTATGKIDLKVLPLPEAKENEGYIAPGNKIEETMVGIWSEVLGIAKELIGIGDNFFRLGGHSLKATAMVSKAHKKLEVTVPLAEVFRTPTIRGLAEYIIKARGSKFDSIEPREKKEYYGLSSSQKRLYVLQQMDPMKTSYNVPAVFALTGRIDPGKLEDTFNKLTQRHESLRTTFEMVDGEPVQVVHERVEFQVEKYKLPTANQKAFCKDLATEGTENQELGAKSYIKSFIRPFDLTRAPLLRVGLLEFRTGGRTGKENRPGHALLMFDIHHIVTDGVSMRLLAQEFMDLYSGKSLPPLRLRYKDYVQGQERKKETPALLQQAAYWQKQFQNEIPVLELPTDFLRPKARDFTGSRIHFEFTTEETRGLKALVLENGTTLYMVLLSIFNVFLAKLTGQEIVVVGTAVAGRRHTDLQHIIGIFVNTLALVNFPGNQRHFNEFLQAVNQGTLEAFENQDYPFEELVKKVDITRDTSRNPLFDVMFDLQPMTSDEIKIPGLKLEPYPHDPGISKFDLMLQAVDERKNLHFIFEYSTALFKEETIGRFIEYFKKVATAVLEQPAVRLSKIEIISAVDKDRILLQFNNTATAYPREKLIHWLFEEEVEKGHDRIAVVYEEYGLSYRALDQGADRLAVYLRDKGVKPGEPVGIMLEASLEVSVGVMAILKAGGAYLPIDPNYPEERINYMLKDSNMRVLVTTPKLQVKVKAEAAENVGLPPGLLPGSINIATDFETAFKPSLSTLTSTSNCQVSPANLAYIIYTSGSTGRPKGVMVEHQNVVRLMFNDKFQFDFNTTDVWTMFHSYCFDFSVWEMYGALLYGGKLVVIPRATARDSKRYLEVLKEQKVTILNQTPSAFYNLINLELQNPGKELYIRWIIFGGEALTPVRLKEWKAKYPGTKLINMYGITETTVHVTFKEIKDKEIASTASCIGKPIPTLSTYVLDKALKLLPIGIPGELCVGGKGVARGYLNQPGLTGEKFINNPYIPGERLYRSGDLVKMSPRGDMEYLGRIDHQVKIRGFRIELAEIESQLLSHGEVEDAAVIVKENNAGDKYLCAYVASHKDGLTAPGIREYLLKKLPGYMIPSFFIFLERIPLTPNGKLDRNALPEPEIKARQGYTAPGNEMEEKLVGIWAETLGISQNTIGIDCSFFDLGGHSLKAALLAAKIHKTFDVSISLVEIFSTPTIRELAAYTKKAAKDKYNSIKPVEKKEYYSLSSAQGRLYVLHRMDEQGIGYNISSVWNVEGEVDTVKFAKVFRELIQRHESLRTSFHMINDTPVQVVHNEVEFEIEYYDMREVEVKVEEGEGTSTIKNFIRSFDLSNAPLLRVGLLKTVEGGYLLLVDMHHIISDGTSMNVVVKDFMALYNEMDLPELRIQYKDFSEWQRQEQQREKIKQQEVFWLQEFSGEIPVLNLPTDYIRPVVQSFEGAVSSFEIHQPVASALKSLANEKGATLYMTLLSLYLVFLTKISNQEDIVVGTPVVGRQHADLEGIIGMFVNTLALRNYPVSEKAFGDFLKEVKTRTLEAFQNQDYPFEDLVERVVANRDTSQNPVFDVMFVFQNMEMPGIDIPGLLLKPYEYENKTSKFDLNLGSMEKDNKLIFSLEYSTKLFKEEKVRKFVGYFKNIIKSIIENPGIRIADIEIMDKEEKERILEISNGIQTPIDLNETIHGMFEKTVLENVDNTALVFRDGRITYNELNRRANRLAYWLRIKGVASDKIVGLMVERSFELVVGILAIMKAGGAYLPIDSEYPGARKKMMLEDSGVQLLLTNCTRENLTAYCPESIHILDLMNKHLYEGNHGNPGLAYRDSDLVYVIYTSGSTGQPKGVMLEHKNLVNLLGFQYNYTDIDCDKILQFATISFDASFHEIFSALLSGGVLHLIDKETRADLPGLLGFIDRNRIKTLFLPMSLLRLISSEDEYIRLLPSCIRHIQTAGEQVVINNRFKDYLKRNHIYLHNHYGPTETHVVTTLTLDPAGEVPERPSIGKPILNTNIYILGKRNYLQPVGVTGELVIGGIQVGRGYIGKPELTSEKFITSPFSKQERLYRSGDLARWLPDGNIEFLGRIDHQVKIRGFRVELGEIESQLSTHNEIKETVVILREENQGNNRYLCGYFVANRNISTSELREYLLKKLPDYMIPSYFVQVEKIPITPNGKIDKRALPAPEMIIGEGYAAPRNKMEEKLVEIWSEILGIEKDLISIDSNFFELGGHSLKAIGMANKIHKIFGVKVTIQNLFRYSSIARVADLIKSSNITGFEDIARQPEQPFYEMSYSQKRLWFINKRYPGNTSFNMPARMTLYEPVDEKIVREVLEQLMQRHESLRTSFKEIDREPVQVVETFNGTRLNYEFIDLSLEDEVERKSRCDQLLMEEYSCIFNLEDAPLFKAKLIKCKEEEYELLINMHHIISDGWSVEILKEEFNTLFNAYQKGATCKLETLRIQYRDYAVWHNRLLASEEKVEKAEKFWKNYLSGTLPGLDLPYDFSPGLGTIRDKKSSAYCFTIDESTTQALRSFSGEQKVSIFMVLLASFNILLSQVTGQEEILLAVPAAAREHWELKNIIGMFVNTLILRTRVNMDIPFCDFFRAVQADFFNVLEYQGYPLELVFSRLKMKYPPISVFFNMVNFDIGHKEKLTGLNTSHIEEVQESKFDIHCYLTEYKNVIQVSCHYFKDLFMFESIERMMRLFSRILENISRDPAKRVKDCCLSGKKKNILCGVKEKLREKKEKTDIRLEIKKEVKEALEKLSKINIDFLEYVEKNPGCFKKSNFQKLDLNDDLFRLQPWPTFINPKSKIQFQEVGVKLFNLIKKIPGKIFNYDLNKMSTFYETPVDILNMQMEGVTEEHIDTLLSRGDFILSSKGLKCLEYNVTPSLGGWQVPIWESLYLKTPILAQFFKENGVKIRNKNLLGLFLEHVIRASLGKVSPNESELNIALVLKGYEEGMTQESWIHSTAAYLDLLYKDILPQVDKSLKGKLIVCNCTHLNLLDGHIFYKDKKIHGVTECYSGMVSTEVMKAFKAGNICLFNGPITNLLSNKLNLTALSDPVFNMVFTDEERKVIDVHVPWTRKVNTRATTYHGETINDLAQFVLSNQEGMVLKPCGGYGGKGIRVGSKTPRDQWEKSVKTALHEKNWVVQERVEAPPGVYHVGEGYADHDIAWGFFIFGSQYTGAWARVMPQGKNKGVVNCHQGATVSVIFEVDE